MYNDKRVLAIVTARGGSKGLPGKNIKVLNGRPLIEWTLSAISHSEYIDETYISTDDTQIAQVCIDFGFDVPDLRPAYLASDTASSMDVLRYSIEKMKENGKEFDYILLLEPTSPLRKKSDLDNIIKLSIDNPEADGVISVGLVHPEHPSIIKRINLDGFIIPYSEKIELTTRRQDEDEAFFPYGVGYLIKVSRFLEENTIYTNKMLPFVIERWQNYEIDDIYDFRCIEAIMKEMKFVL